MAAATHVPYIKPGIVAELELTSSTYSIILETCCKPSTLESPESSRFGRFVPVLGCSSPPQLSPSHTGLAVGLPVGCSVGYSSPPQLSPSQTGLAEGYSAGRSVGYASPPQLSPFHAVGSEVGSGVGSGVVSGVGSGVGSDVGAGVGRGVGNGVG
jgi:hypothetical protein